MDRGRIDTYALDGTHAIAVAPGWGCNMFAWTVEGEDLMYAPEDYPAAAWKITGGGNPVLFPAVGRTWDTSGPGEPVQGAYRIHGSEKTYHMPSHGILFLCDFRKTHEERGAETLTVAYEALIPEEVRQESYPFDVSFSQRYTLRRDRVDLEATATNNGQTPAPAAFGYHPYFAISSPERAGVTVRLPVTERLVLTEDTVLPTGEVLPTDGVIDLQPDVYYDHAFAGANGHRMSLIDRQAGRAIHVEFGDWAELFFAYAPDGSPFFCIEPWTRGLGVFARLNAPGWESDPEIPVLAPGETRSYGASFILDRSL